MQFRWLFYFCCTICLIMPPEGWPNTASGCNLKLICMPMQLQLGCTKDIIVGQIAWINDRSIWCNRRESSNSKVTGHREAQCRTILWCLSNKPRPSSFSNCSSSSANFRRFALSLQIRRFQVSWCCCCQTFHQFYYLQVLWTRSCSHVIVKKYATELLKISLVVIYFKCSLQMCTKMNGFEFYFSKIFWGGFKLLLRLLFCRAFNSD